MTPEQKQHWRYTFAGQALQASVNIKSVNDITAMANICAIIADALITALEASEPKACEHHWDDETDAPLRTCNVCGIQVIP